MRFIQDRDYVRWSRANNHYYYHDMLGIDRIVNREVRIWGNQRDVLTGGLELKKRLRDFAYNITFLNSFRMTPSQMKSYIDLINRVRPPIVNGYAGSLFELCRYARTTGVSFPTPRLLASSAETLTDEMRSEIESMFHLPVHDFYGSREAENLAAQCDARLYHQFLFSHVIEVVDERGEPVEEGEEGRIVITPLHNYSMPLLRYVIGDVAVVGPAECPCGNPLPTLARIQGRLTAQFRTAEGTLVYGGFFTRLFIRRDWVKSFRIVQTAFDHVEIYVVADGAIPESDKTEIERDIRHVMGASCTILWYPVDDIPKSKSGKNMYVISRI
jgi:phenylacetate-CoA ligase